MRFYRFWSLVCLAAGVSAAAGLPQAKMALAQLPLRFEANQGRMDPAVQYAARTSGYTLLLTSKGPSLAFPDSRRIDINMLGSNRAAGIEGLGKLSARTDSFIGRRENWQTQIPSYERVRYRSVYPGVDVVYYGNQNQLEFDFVLEPGADPNSILMQFQGAKHLRIDPAGDLLIESGGSQIVQKRPFIYQEAAGGERREISGRYMLLARNTIGIRLEHYDRKRRLVIDPEINYLTYLGGSGGDRVNAVKLGPDGRLYVVGQTDTGYLTATSGAYKETRPGLVDGFLAIFDTAPGNRYTLAYLTYFGGTEPAGGQGGNDIPRSVDVDTAGFVYITGTTTSTDFPLAGNALANTAAAVTVEAFVMKLRPKDVGAEALWYSTFLGGNLGDDSGNGIAVDKDGMIYVIGTTKSEDFPVVSTTAYQPVKWGPQDIFLSKINPTTGGLLYSTYLGGEDAEEGRAIVLAPNGLVYFAASTLSQMFPWAGFAYSNIPFGAQDAIVGVLDTNKNGFESLVYSSYYGGSSNDDVRGLSLDSRGNAIVTGYTLSTDFPTTPDALQNVNLGGGDVFVTVIDPLIGFPARINYSTFLGGSGGDVAYDAKADAAGNIYVTGYSLSQDFPIAGAAPQTQWGGGTNVFVTKFRPGVAGRSALSFSTYVGATGTYVPTGLALGPGGTMYVVGYAGSGLPLTDGHINGFNGGASDGFLFVIEQ